MSLLRTAPREVYRVYGEEAFFAGVDHDGRLETTALTGGHGAHRLAAVALRLAAVGAAGGLVAMSVLAPAGARRDRLGESLRAAAQLLAGRRVAHRQIWRVQPFVGGSAGDAHSADHRLSARRVRHAGERLEQPASWPQAAAVAVPVAQTPASGMRLMASAPASSRSPGRAEFGFER